MTTNKSKHTDPARRATLSLAIIIGLSIGAGCARPGQPSGSAPPLSDNATAASTEPTVDLAGYPDPSVERSDQDTWATARAITIEPEADHPYPPPNPEATAQHLNWALEAAINARDADALEVLIAGSFTTIHFPEGGSDISSEAVRDLIGESEPPGSQTITFDDVPESVPAIEDALRGYVDHDLAIRDVLFSRGWGKDGRGESAFFVLERDSRPFLAGRIHAELGFDAAPDADSDTTRTIAFELADVSFALEFPASWHSDSTYKGRRIASYPPWQYQYEDAHNPGAAVPLDATKIEFYDVTRTNESIDQALANVDYYGEPPTSRDEERITLASGHEAGLGRYRMENGYSFATFLVADPESGLAMLRAWCYGDVTPCDPVSRSVRIH